MAPLISWFASYPFTVYTVPPTVHNPISTHLAIPAPQIHLCRLCAPYKRLYYYYYYYYYYYTCMDECTERSSACDQLFASSVVFRRVTKIGFRVDPFSPRHRRSPAAAAMQCPRMMLHNYADNTKLCQLSVLSSSYECQQRRGVRVSAAASQPTAAEQRQSADTALHFSTSSASDINTLLTA